MNDCKTPWVQELQSGLRRLQDLVKQENQLLRKDPRQAKQHLSLVISEEQQVLASRIEYIVSLKNQLGGLHKQEQKPVEAPPAQKRPRVMPPRRPANFQQIAAQA